MLRNCRRFGAAALAAACAFSAHVHSQTASPQARDPRAVPPASAATGVIAGTLTVSDTGRPARQARVAISGGDPRTVKNVTTDDEGRFTFADLPAGTFNLTATKPGFLDVAYGQRRPGSGRPGTPIQLTAGQKLDHLALQIPRGGVITGTVIDPFGDPMFNTEVRAMRYVMRNGLRTLQQAGSGSTDDRGIYRIPALLPGDYLVSALPRDIQAMAEVEMMRAKMELAVAVEKQAAKAQALEARREDLTNLLAIQAAIDRPTSGYTQTFHPGTTQLASASTVTLDISEEKQAIDLRPQIVPFATVSGSVVASGALPKGVQVQMVEIGQPIPGLNLRSARLTPDGRFSFTGVPPGQYQITARASVPTDVSQEAADALDRAKAALETKGQPYVVKSTLAASAETLWAMTDLAVNGGNILDVSLSLQKGMAISGNVVFDGGNTASLDVTKMRVTLELAPGAPFVFADTAVPDAALDNSGRFTIRGVLPGTYRVVPSRGIPPAYTIESSVFAGRDILDIPLEVRPGEDQSGGVLTFATAQTDLIGTLRDSAGKPVADYTLVVFAADQRMWLPGSRRIQAVRPATDGRYQFKGLPPGEYRLAALVDVEQGQWFDPAFLREIGGASIAVSLGRGEKKTQDLSVAR